MRAVIQRVSRAAVSVDGDVVGQISHGLAILLGAAAGDTQGDVDVLVDKVAGLRIFRDDQQKMNRSVVDVGGSVLLISQFTLLADARRGRRPSFVDAAVPGEAEPLIEYAVRRLTDLGVPVETGIFGADMSVELVNDGPVTIVLDVVDGKVR
ncbi:MAG: D-tyrosyl-tRNA(Tyr) deacylase [Acidimicrobiia bacterium]|nr:D-tyrosyl-tRNA(Tyr) deacylase [Acidimicrobiia bacterium]